MRPTVPRQTVLRQTVPARPSSLRSALCVLLAAAALAHAGCMGDITRHNTTSVVDFLYPDVREPIATPAIPVLELPLRVGVAFVPAGRLQTGYQVPLALSESQRRELLEKVAAHFEERPFVESIEVIPSSYLQPGGSFENLDQLRRMFRIDVVALVSYDQVQFTDQGLLSLTYWTIVGQYVVPGERNDTHTMLDTVVYDIPSRELLFRAPGSHHVEGRATPVNLTEELREDSVAGFEGAAEEMIANLDQELERFRERVRERPGEVRVVETEGYQGGGSLDPLLVALAAALAGAFRRRRG